MSDPVEPIHRALGLTDDELQLIIGVLSREPNHLELAMYSVMWSEHCSYKSSRVHLKRLPTEGPEVLVGPGENAGVVAAGDGIAVAIRIESHNHPSAIEPYQGAATGVGGILRDIFTMGARPLAVMDPLFFGEMVDARQRWLFDGIVSGISGYGNSVGVPTIGGELTFDPCYAQNPLVNVLCLGALPEERLVLGQASGTGNLGVLLGSTTGRDGIGGVSVLASAGFSGADGAEGIDEAKRPSVQVGDPFEEKRLIEACLALLDAKLVVGIQDLGGAGLCCATSETAARGRVGMDVDVNAIPRRAHGEPEGRLRIRNGFDGEIIADVPAASLADDAPLYHRPLAKPANHDAVAADDPRDEAEGDILADLLSLVRSSASVYQRYDHQLFLNTVVGPGADAALLKLAGPGLPESKRGIAVSTDSAPRACAIDPRRGAALVVAEGLANVACVGGRGVAIVNCLNFGNPEHPEVMWQLSEAVDGMAEASLELGLPIIGGNVSLYNESGGRDIDPTPVIGTLGLVDLIAARPPSMNWGEGESLVLLGPRAQGAERPFPLGASRWAVECRGRRGGPLPTLDYGVHRAVTSFVASLVSEALAGAPGRISAVHDISSGGIGTALLEMAVASGSGFTCELEFTRDELFTEAPSRFLVATQDSPALLAAAEAAGVPATVLGSTGGDKLQLASLSLSLASVLSADARSLV
ncbi:MAG: phosphoribosylformylglycinamidine synthase subunit PurL [Actinobacteria bacterium]|nr:phosphoribosylformylglycinamidine synthase subunit PurL [Actinomycetota bacterium]